ncbi:MAG TPA: ABC transporter substrate-binding protein, partial [Reyranella sp.]|nr:ABC transporter substrate-binding protein [Reyranella sp.]
WGIWNFSKNVPAAKSLLAHLSTAAATEKMVVASGGYDLPSFANLTKFKVWAEAEPPKGTLFHYPDPYHTQTLSIACAPAPHKIAEQIYNQGIQTQMAVRYFKGEALEKTLAWAEGEIEGFMRN